jgi:hypothetical protein
MMNVADTMKSYILVEHRADACIDKKRLEINSIFEAANGVGLQTLGPILALQSVPP